MTGEIATVLGILVIAIVLFATEKVRVDVVSLMVMLAVMLTGILEPNEAFAEFGNPAVITVWAIYIVSASLAYTGIADYIGKYIGQIAGQQESRLILVLMIAVGSMSAFMNNIGATAVLLPVAVSLGKKANVPVSKLLIPLAFGSLLGGVTTLIGTPPNILVNTELAKFGVEPFHIFDFTPMGLIILVSSITYMVLIGRHLLPAYTDQTHSDQSGRLTTEYKLEDFLTELHVTADSPLIGKTMVESRLGQDYRLTVIGMMREGRVRLGVLPNAHIRQGDILITRGLPKQILKAEREIGLSIGPEHELTAERLNSEEAAVAELVVSQKAHFLGQSLRQINFRVRYGLTVLAIWREEGPFEGRLKDEPLRLGDTLLVHGRRERIEAVRENSAFLLLQTPDEPSPRLNKAPINMLIFVSMITLVSFGVLHISVAAVLGAVLAVLTGCLNMDEAYESIEWKTVFLIAGMLPMAIAMQKTGTDTYLASLIIGGVGRFGPLGVLTGLFILTTGLTAFMSNAAVAALVAPIAIQSAFNLGIDPHAFVLGVAIAASNSFVTPIGHQACVLVYGPGGYRFFDYTKVGVPLTLLIWVLMIIFLPILWPFTG